MKSQFLQAAGRKNDLFVVTEIQFGTYSINLANFNMMRRTGYPDKTPPSVAKILF